MPRPFGHTPGSVQERSARKKKVMSFQMVCSLKAGSCLAEPFESGGSKNGLAMGARHFLLAVALSGAHSLFKRTHMPQGGEELHYMNIVSFHSAAAMLNKTHFLSSRSDAFFFGEDGLCPSATRVK